MEKRLQIYTDGSYRLSYPSLVGWAFIAVDNETVLDKVSGALDNSEIAKMYQIAGELYAVMAACKYADKYNILIEIHYDYEGIEFWAYDAWKANKPFTQYYKKFIQPYVKKRIVTFKKTLAHKGFNIVADTLAYNAIENKYPKE